MDEKRACFVKSSDSDITKVVSNVVPESTKEVNKIRNRKLKSAQFFGYFEFI